MNTFAWNDTLSQRHHNLNYRQVECHWIWKWDLCKGSQFKIQLQDGLKASTMGVAVKTGRRQNQRCADCEENATWENTM